MDELRSTDTNSANDSHGRAFGMEGNDFIYVLLAFVISLGLDLICTVVVHMGVIAAALLSFPLLVATISWIWVFRRGKPEGYAEDFFDQLLNSEGWSAPRYITPSLSDVRKPS